MNEHADIVVVGAGPVGMTLAVALAQGRSPLRVVLLESRSRGAFVEDPRILALSHGTRQLLGQLDAWDDRAATPIHDIHVSQRGGFGRTRIDRADYRLPALGYVMRYRHLAAALDERLGDVAVHDGARLESVEAGRDGVVVTCRQGGDRLRLAARLVVHAEGTPPDDPAVSVFDYRQHAVITEVVPEPAHGHRAWERFTPDGPLALLPIGEEYSVVFTVPPDRADALMALDDAGFLAALRAQFGPRVDFRSVTARTRFPLALRVRRETTAQRQVWIGNTAQTLHPVSGQGFNLGIRDAWQLAEVLAEADDPGAVAGLAAYAASRRLDRGGGMAFTDAVVRVFSNDFGPLRVARGLGLLALDMVPPARHFVARRMMFGARAWF